MATFEWDPQKLERLPEQHRGPMQRYVEKGVWPGDGLRSIIVNDKVSEVIHCCDDQTVAALPAIYRFLYNCVPAKAWGSKDKFTAWQDAGGIEGQSDD